MIIVRQFLIHGIPQQLYLNFCSNPKGTLLFLHGGPGWADAPWAGLICKSFWGMFNTVHWDQRGCNRSQPESLKRSTITIDQIVKDGIEVCSVLKKEFQIKNPILVGHSTGAFLGVLMASKTPELFRACISIGQLVCNNESEPISLAFCKHKAKDLERQDLLSELNVMPTDFYRSVPSLFRQREIVAEFGGELQKPVNEKQWKQWMLESPKEYRSKWPKLYQGCESTCKKLWPDLIERSLYKEVKKLKLPITILQGRHDYCTPSAPVVKWLEGLSCTHTKELIWFEQSAHWPQIEENEKFSKIILNLI